MRQIAQLANNLRENGEGVVDVIPGRIGGVDVEQLHAGQDGVETDLFVCVGDERYERGGEGGYAGIISRDYIFGG